MNGSKKIKILFGIIIALAAVSAILCVLWGRGHLLLHWIVWKSGTFYDTSGQYEIVLEYKTAEVFCDNRSIWTAPEGVKVQDAMSCDIDNDGEDELILLCWKVGRFGKSKPFWVEQDEKNWSQHIFVYEYDREKMKPKWMSSYIGQDVTEMAVSSRQTGSRTADGKRSLQQHLLLADRDGNISSWIWDSWGFTKEDTDISFVVLGDNLIHEPIYQYGLQNDEGFGFLFENIHKVIDISDVAVINQETPLTDQPSRYSDYPRFGTPAGVGEAIADAGFDVVTCATNHAFDQGVAGINFTREFFDTRHIMCIGTQSEEEKEYRPYEVLTRNGVRFALFNYTYGTNGIAIPEEKSYMVHLLKDEEKIRADIETAKTETDLVLVFVHWGTEYQEQPDEFQQKWTKVFLESKVDAVIGTHPHTLQPCEMLQDDSGHEMLVYYSIGNYISAQPEKSCVKGGMAKFTVSLTSEGFKITEYELQPLTITWQEGGKYTVDFLSGGLLSAS